MATVAASPISRLDRGDRVLLEAARRASTRAYAPYSGLKVGAVVRTSQGKLYHACNVENASYGLTSCAERNAVFAAVAEEGEGMRVIAIAIFAHADAVSPCGACRQVLAEFGEDAKVLFPSGDTVRITTVADLLPEPFKMRRDLGSGGLHSEGG
jgi:cytidine deaminase